MRRASRAADRTASLTAGPPDASDDGGSDASTVAPDGGTTCGPTADGLACGAPPSGAPPGKTFCGLDGRCRTLRVVYEVPEARAPRLQERTAAWGYGASSILIATGFLGYNDVRVRIVTIAGTITDCGLVAGPSPYAGTAVSNGDAYAFTGTTANEARLLLCSAGGKVAALTSTTARVVAMTADDVYLATTNNELARCPRTGCAALDVLTGRFPSAIGSVRIDASGIYVGVGTTVGRIDLSSGDLVPLAILAKPPAFELDGDRLLIAQDDGIVSCAKTGCGGAPTPFVAQQGISPRTMSVDSRDVYWADLQGITYSCPKTGPCASPKKILQFSPDAADETRLWGGFGYVEK